MVIISEPTDDLSGAKSSPTSNKGSGGVGAIGTPRINTTRVTVLPLDSAEPPFALITDKLAKHCQTHRHLLATLDGDKCSSELFQEILGLFANTLFYGVHSYRPPSAASRQKLQSGRVRWHNKDLSVSKLEQDFAIKISDELQLDELQSFDLFRAYLREMSLDREDFTYDDEGVQGIVRAYYLERQSLLHSIINIIRNTMAEEHQFHRESKEFMQVLIDKGLDDELMNQFVELAEHTPVHMKNEAGAIQMVEEMITLLCAVFLLYYHEVPKSADKFIYVIEVFKEIKFGENIFAIEYGHIPQVAQLILTLKHMCVLVSLVLMQLEDLQDEEKLPDHMFVVDKQKINDQIFKTREDQPWWSVDAHAPVLLGWSMWCSAASRYGYGNYETELVDKSLRCGAITYLTNMLKNGLDKDDMAIFGYKSVVKGLVSGCLVVYEGEKNSKIWEEYNVFELYCTTNDNCPPLASQFWAYEEAHPVLGAWVRIAAQKFVVEKEPLLQVMKALSSDQASSERAYYYLEHLTLTTPVNLFGEGDLLVESGNGAECDCAVAMRPLGVNNNEIIVPLNARGDVVANNVVAWGYEYDAWSGIINNLKDLTQNLPRRLSEEQFQSAFASLNLISTLMKHDDELVHRFYSSYDGMLPKLLPAFVIECLNYNHPLPLIASAMSCIYFMAKTCSVTLMWRRLAPNLFSLAGDKLRQREQAAQSFPVTMSILDIIDCVLFSSVQSKQLAEQELFEETTVVQLSEMGDALKFCYEVFTSFAGWSYESIREKWIVGVRTMEIFHKVLTDYSPYGPDEDHDPNNRVHKQVLLWLLTNKHIQRNLFSIISIGVEVIEGLYKHRDLLETFVLLALALIDIALTLLPSDQVTTLQNALFEGNTINDIAGFSRYRKNPDVTVRALRILIQASRTKISLATCLTDLPRLRASWLSSLTLHTSPNSVRFNILAFLSSIILHQPTLIIAICGIKAVELDNSIARRPDESKNSLGKAILNLLEHKPMENCPQVCSELCRVVYLLWKHANSLDLVVDLRASKPFWDYMTEITLSHQAESSYNTSARAWALLTISLEIGAPRTNTHTAPSFNSIAKSETQHQWIANYILTGLSSDLESFTPLKGFASIPIIISDFDLDKVYGDRFYYDTARLERKNAPEILITKIKSANICLSYAEAHSFFLRAWSTFIHASLKQNSSVAFNDVPSMIGAVADKLLAILQNETSSLSLFDGVAPLFLVMCKLLPEQAKVSHQNLIKIISCVAFVLSHAKTTKPDSLAHICTGLVLLLRKADVGNWQDAELIRANELLVDACWSLVDTNSYPLLDSIFCVLGALLQATESASMILNSTKQPSLLTFMDVFARSLYKEENHQHAENILSVILQLASYPVSASSLLQDGLLNVLCNKNAPFFTKFSHPVYNTSNATPAGVRNPWHRVWCTCIAVVTQILRTLKFTDDATRTAIAFVNTHSDKFWEAVHLQNKELKLGTLEELEVVLQLFKELAIYTNKWRLAPVEFANTWGMAIVHLVHYLLVVFSSDAGLKQILLESNDPSEKNAPEDAKETLMLNNVLNCFYILQMSGPQASRLIAARGDPKRLEAEVESTMYIFLPSGNFNANSPPNLAIPAYAIHHSFAALKGMTPSAGQSGQLYCNKFQAHNHRTFITLIEIALTIFLSHTLYFTHKLDVRLHPEEVQAVHKEGSDMVRSLGNYLYDLREIINGREWDMVKQVHHVLIGHFRVGGGS